MTRDVPAALINAFHHAAQHYNAAQSEVHVLLRFFVGQTSHPLLDEGRAVDSTHLAEGHQDKLNSSRHLPHFVKGTFPENMDEGKTPAWFRWAATSFPSSDWVLKLDTDVSINWFVFGTFLAGTPAGKALRYLGYTNDNARCGGYSHCPPVGCKSMKGRCWIYMSGGLYGASTQLAKLLSNCSYYSQHAKGFEDLQFGLAVKNCVPHIRSLQLVNMPVGQGWCHSKAVTPMHVRWGYMIRGCR